MRSYLTKSWLPGPLHKATHGQGAITPIIHGSWLTPVTPVNPSPAGGAIVVQCYVDQVLKLVCDIR